MKTYSTDLPIEKIEEDKFQRENFSKRIAETIYRNQGQESLVIGLYGEWGSGKTSVLNIISQTLRELDEKDDKLVFIKFNPWRFADDDSLLIAFFQSFEKPLKISLKSFWKKLGIGINRSASVLDKISDGWNSTVAFLSPSWLIWGKISGSAAKTVKAITPEVEDVKIEGLKKKLDKKILKTGKKVVVIIDDIDRLDKKEMYSILRLVKLNANFPNTTYLLAFDEKRVSEAISEQFGFEASDAGTNFLEKIIQVPIRLPKLLHSDMESFCFSEIQNTLNSLGLNIENKDIVAFATKFREHMLPYIKTPRLIKRYINSISFSVPLLYKEVNLSDLLLIEALKVFYPDFYELIKSDSKLFLTSFTTPVNDQLSLQNIEKTKKHLQEELNRVFKRYSGKEKSDILLLVEYLFPFIEGVDTRNDYSWEYDNYWVDSKRICTKQYHDRYFLYAVLKGDLSEVGFENYLNSIDSLSQQTCNQKLVDLIQSSSQTAVLKRFEGLDKEVSKEITNKICLAVCSIGSTFTSDNIFITPLTTQYLYAKCIVKLAARNEDGSFAFIKEMISYADSAVFAQTLWETITFEKKKVIVFDDSQLDEIAGCFINKVLEKTAKQPVFEVENIDMNHFIDAWIRYDKPAWDNYIQDTLKDFPSRVLSLLGSLAGRMRYVGDKEDRKKSFTTEDYAYFKKVLDVKFIYECIEKAYPEELKVYPQWTKDEPVTDDKIFLHQFVHYYTQEVEKKRARIITD